MTEPTNKRPYEGFAMTSGREVGLCWAKEDRNSVAFHRLGSFVGLPDVEDLLFGGCDSFSTAERFAALLNGEHLPIRLHGTKKERLDRMIELNEASKAFWHVLLGKSRRTKINLLHDKLFYAGFIEGVISVVEKGE